MIPKVKKKQKTKNKKNFALIGENKVSRGQKIAKCFKFCEDKFSQICKNR